MSDNEYPVGTKKEVRIKGVEIGDVERFKSGWYAWSTEIETYLDNPKTNTTKFDTMQEAVGTLVGNHGARQQVANLIESLDALGVLQELDTGDDAETTEEY